MEDELAEKAGLLAAVPHLRASPFETPHQSFPRVARNERTPASLRLFRHFGAQDWTSRISAYAACGMNFSPVLSARCAKKKKPQLR